MTDPTKLSEDMLLTVVSGHSARYEEAAQEVLRRFAALTERISELERDNRSLRLAVEAEHNVRVMDNEHLIARAEAAETERDEARAEVETGYSCYSDVTAELSGVRARVVVLENALREIAAGVDHPEGMHEGSEPFYVAVEWAQSIARAALAVRAEETNG